MTSGMRKDESKRCDNWYWVADSLARGMCGHACSKAGGRETSAATRYAAADFFIVIVEEGRTEDSGLRELRPHTSARVGGYLLLIGHLNRDLVGRLSAHQPFGEVLLVTGSAGRALGST